MDFLNRIVAFFMSIVSFFASLFGLGDITAEKERVNLDNFQLVWSDEFDGAELDKTKWKFPTTGTTVRRGGYWNSELLEVEDGELTIYTKYLENGVKEGDEAGWYTTAINTNGLFEQAYGYIEARAIIPKGHGLWSAFWMVNQDGVTNPYPDGSYGGEVDIFETFYYDTDKPNRVAGAVHWGGYGEAHTSIHVNYDCSLLKNPYDEYNTYGLEWNEDRYIIYLNGVKAATVEKDRAITSRVPMYLVLSCEVSGKDGIPGDNGIIKHANNNSKDFVAEFKIDYVRAYQYK